MQRMQAAKNNCHQHIGQAQATDLRAKFSCQPVVQSQPEHSFFDDRCNHQQCEQRAGGTGSAAKAQSYLQDQPGAERTAGSGCSKVNKFGATRWRKGWGHGLRMIAVTVMLLPPMMAMASLGETESSISIDRMRMGARHQIEVKAKYSVHHLQGADGSRLREYVAANGAVFAVAWHTLSKPDLSAVLGASYPAYATSAQAAAHRAGIQRRFRHEDLDLVVQSTAHLNVFSGFAFRRSMLPAGLSPDRIGLE